MNCKNMKKTNKKNNTCKKEEQNANSKTKNLDVMMIEQEDITYKIMSDDDIEMMKMSDTTSANEKDNKKMMDNLEVMVNETIDKYNKTKLVTDQSNGINNDNNSISSDIMKDSQRNTQANSGKKTIIQIHNNDDNNSFTVKKEKKKKKKEKKNKGTVENGNSDENDITYNLDNNDEKILNDRDEVNKTTIPSNDQSAASKTMMAPSSEKLTQPSIQSLKSSATKEMNVPVNTLSTMESRKRKLDDKEVDHFSDKEMETLSNSKYMSDVHLSEKITPTINKEHDKDKRKRKLVDKKVDKSNKRKRVPRTTLKGLSERFYKMFNLIPVDPIPFFVFASTVKDSFTCTDKSFSKKRELKFDTNYTKEEIEKIITKSLYLLREYVNKTYISDSITNDEFVTSFNKFPVNQRVKQDCVLAPKSFSLYLTAVLEFCPIDGSVYLTTFQPTSPPVCAKELLYADDSAPVVQAQLQPLIDGFNIAASSFAHTINRKLKSCFHPIPTSEP
ncbi:general transcriptional corepressor trfA-like [Penaeus japonicus]|uniref:general transcriptional corepressor trfA-like n=1 Tax=Penaeus japonicus TaxID=27405 RepID=UPI001C710B79|nr:general transcriptional corepressor trfA-like [Penaeus japonicus]